MSDVVVDLKPKSFFSGNKKKRPAKALFIIGGVVSVVVIIGSWFLWQYYESNTKISDTNIAKTALDDANRLIAANKNTEAKDAYDLAISKTQSPEKKAMLYLNKSSVFLSEKDYDGALICAKEAEALLPHDVTVLRSIAQIYVDKNDKVNAIEYYKKVIEYTDKNDVMSGSDIENYKAKIKFLGGSI